MITAHLVGDEAVLAWLRAAPNAVASGLARTISELGLSLQRKVQGDDLTGQTLAEPPGSLKPNVDLQVDQSDDRIAATISSDGRYPRAFEYRSVGSVDVRASLRRVKEASRRAISEKKINMQSYPRRIDLPERSFLRSALEDMDPEIRDGVEESLRGALTR